MKTITVYDPPLCCSTGVCGPEVDPVLPQVAGFLQQMSQHGVEVQRYNLAQEPMAFVQNKAVKSLLESDGVEVLPLIFVDGDLRMKGSYPDADLRKVWIQELGAAK